MHSDKCIIAIQQSKIQEIQHDISNISTATQQDKN
jgi:hypothetical protein